jgi:hypothetical protein
MLKRIDELTESIVVGGGTPTSSMAILLKSSWLSKLLAQN